MSKYTLICEEWNKGPKITMEFETDDLTVILEQMETFVRATGFSWVGELQFAEDSDKYKPEFDYSYQVPEYQEEKQYKFQFPTMSDDSYMTMFGDDVNFTPDSDYSPPVEQRYDARCFLCGIEKEVMKGYTCHDVKCPKGTW